MTFDDWLRLNGTPEANVSARLAWDTATAQGDAEVEAERERCAAIADDEAARASRTASAGKTPEGSYCVARAIEDRILEDHMTATETAILRAIVENPAEDTPRLIYADWLDENGEADRAEFIRVQVENSKLSERATIAVQHKQQADRRAKCELINCRMCRERNLLNTSERAWRTGPLAEVEVWANVEATVPGAYRFEAEFHRGFISHIVCSAADWLAHCDSLVWHPTQTVACVACAGEGYNPEIDWPASNECMACDGTGRAIRPFPTTAQPIERVTLTTWPDSTHVGWRYRLVDRDTWHDLREFLRDPPPAAEQGMLSAMIAAEWPGVVFGFSRPLVTHWLTGVVYLPDELVVDSVAPGVP